jgi:hypothetical protein
MKHLTGLMLAKLRATLSYEIELVTLLLLVLASGVTYGILEALYVPTDTMKAKVIPWTAGHVAYYHLCLLSLMAVASFSLALLHIQWILLHRKKYTILMGVASMPLALLIEDITWFITRWQPIHRDEWTVIPKGWAFPLGFTWVPLWYLGAVAFSICLLLLASKYATQGYKKFLTSSREDDLMK